MKTLFFVLALVSVAMSAQGQGPAWSRTNTELLCGASVTDTRIEMCTTLIQNGGEDAVHLARIYYNRGSSYFEKGLYDQAVADFTKAIELRHDSTTYADRGRAYGSESLYDCAITDYSKAIKLSPMEAGLYNHRAQHMPEAE